jgi:hypothetical protein
MMPSYNVIQSGHILEVYEYRSGVMGLRDDDIVISREGGRDKEGQEDRKAEYRQTVNHKAREKVRRLINANFDEHSLFVTLTFAENMTDIEYANYELKKFLQKMKRRQKNFAYVAVIEFQKRGAVHYHMLCNLHLEWTTHKELQKHERELAAIWGNGFVDIGYRKNDNAGAYLIKYMSKEHNDERLNGKKRYFFSRNLKQPKKLTGLEAMKALQSLEGVPPVFTNSYYNDFTGPVLYREYNPKRYNSNLQSYYIEKAQELFGDLVEVK